MSFAPSFLQAAYRWACCMDVSAIKPGNVYLGSPAYQMHGQDFLTSAECSAPKLLDTELELGQRIEQAALATHQAVGTNTNLGILLLCAPLLCAAQRYPQLQLQVALEKVLSATTVADTQAVYRAIQLLQPGGLGKAGKHDVFDVPTVNLREAMSSAADRDLIALQYQDGFRLVFESLLLRFQQLLSERLSLHLAISYLFLWLLSQHPDTHIQRKHGRESALAVSQAAARCLNDCRQTQDQGLVKAHLHQFDRELKTQSLNPGTSADLCVATLLSYRLQQRAQQQTGVDPAAYGVTEPSPVRITPSSTCQTFEGDMQWL